MADNIFFGNDNVWVTFGGSPFKAHIHIGDTPGEEGGVVRASEFYVIMEEDVTVPEVHWLAGECVEHIARHQLQKREVTD